MKNRFVNFGSIEGVVNQMKALQFWAESNESKVKPFIATGHTKVHGTNMGIGYWSDGIVTWQTRSQVLSPTDKDSFGMGFYVNQFGIDNIKNILEPLLGDAKGIMLFGEFIGKGIQKGVAVSELDKSFILFRIVKVYDGVDENNKHCWKRERLDTSLIKSIPEKFFYNINDFKTFSQEVSPYKQESIDAIMVHTLEVEESCPVGTSINPDVENKVGEGIVWTANVELENGNTKTITFKSKGDKHKRSTGSAKSKQVIEYTPEQNDAIAKFFDVAVTNDRLEQGFEFILQSGKIVEIKNTGMYIKWVIGDIQKEHSGDVVDILYPVALQWESINKLVTNAAKDYYLNRVNQL